jgi:hypothetical protein
MNDMEVNKLSSESESEWRNEDDTNYLFILHFQMTQSN